MTDDAAYETVNNPERGILWRSPVLDALEPLVQHWQDTMKPYVVANALIDSGLISNLRRTQEISETFRVEFNRQSEQRQASLAWLNKAVQPGLQFWEKNEESIRQIAASITNNYSPIELPPSVVEFFQSSYGVHIPSINIVVPRHARNDSPRSSPSKATEETSTSVTPSAFHLPLPRLRYLRLPKASRDYSTTEANTLITFYLTLGAKLTLEDVQHLTGCDHSTASRRMNRLETGDIPVIKGHVRVRRLDHTAELLVAWYIDPIFLTGHRVTSD